MRAVWVFDSASVKLYYSPSRPVNARSDCGKAETSAMNRLGKSILATMGLFAVVQILIFSAFAATAVPSNPFVPRGFILRYGPWFLLVALPFYAVLLTMLFIFKNDFIKEPSGERLERVNLANVVTLFRVTSMPTLLFLVLAAKDYRIRLPLLCLVVLVFATDFADGYISRKAGQVTRVGRMMDSASDYALLIVLTIVFYYFTLVPPWFFLLVTARLGEQAVFVFILVLVNKRFEPKTTFMGKAAVASIMVLYAVEVIRLIFGLGRIEFIAVLEWATAAIVLLSMVDKVVAFARELPKSA
jgi:phosphatidylglycerophosphate synthase